MKDYWDNLYKNEWRQLGFYYETDENKKQWLFFGSKEGLSNFNTCIDHHLKFRKDISDDSHFGPYNYLKLMIWNEPFIDLNVIAGRKENFELLKKIFSSKVEETILGNDFVIDKEYSSNNLALIKVKIMNDNFDPVSMDIQLNK